MLCAVERCSKTLRKNDPSLFQPQPYEAPSTGHPHLKPCLGKGAQVHASPCHVLDALLHTPPPPQHLCSLLFPLLISHSVVNGTDRTCSPISTCVLPLAGSGQQMAGPTAGCLGCKGISTCPHTEHTAPLLAVRVCRNFTMTSRGRTRSELGKCNGK